MFKFSLDVSVVIVFWVNLKGFRDLTLGVLSGWFATEYLFFLTTLWEISREPISFLPVVYMKFTCLVFLRM